MTRTAITPGELTQLTICSDQLVSGTFGWPVKTTPSRLARKASARTKLSAFSRSTPSSLPPIVIEAASSIVVFSCIRISWQETLIKAPAEMVSVVT
ncbi:MAG: hypothetical protein NTZ17_02660 [Phycisphaerae bacterium]|nr:hypothetical protein [Phycisphaerae bacterium]